jgi:hypothetical protein
VLRVATYNVYLGADLTLVFGARDSGDLERRTDRVLGQLEATDFAERARALAGVLVAAGADVVLGRPGAPGAGAGRHHAHRGACGPRTMPVSWPRSSLRWPRVGCVPAGAVRRGKA